MSIHESENKIGENSPYEGSKPQDSSSDTSDEKHVYLAESLSGPRQFLLVGTMCMAMFTNQLGLGNTLGIVNVIGSSFGLTEIGDLSWLVAGYSLTIGTFILVGGRFGDDFGYRNMFILGMAWYSLWSLVAGLAVYSNNVLFVFARIFQGMGPALTLPNALAILGRAYPNGSRKNMAFAWFGGTAPFGAIAGFAFGALFSLAWWPWAFWSQAIALAALTVLATLVVPSEPIPEETQKRTLSEKLAHLDLIGGLAGVTALVLFNFAWNQSVLSGWAAPEVIVTLIIGVMLFAAFFAYEMHWASNPIVPVASFNMDILFVLGCTAAGWATFGIWVFYAAQLVTQLEGVSPLLLAAWYSPVVPSGLISALLVGKLLGKISAAWIMVVGQVAFVIGSILIAVMPLGSIYWGYFFCSVWIICIGMDSSFPAATIIFSDAVEPQYQGIAASFVLTIVNYSISLGLGFAGTVETQTNNGGHTPEDLLTGYRGAMYMGVGLAGLGLILSLIFVIKSPITIRNLNEETNSTHTKERESV